MVKREVPTTPFLPARYPALPQPLSECCAHCFTYPAANGDLDWCRLEGPPPESHQSSGTGPR